MLRSELAGPFVADGKFNVIFAEVMTGADGRSKGCGCVPLSCRPTYNLGSLTGFISKCRRVRHPRGCPTSHPGAQRQGAHGQARLHPRGPCHLYLDHLTQSSCPDKTVSIRFRDFRTERSKPVSEDHPEVDSHPALQVVEGSAALLDTVVPLLGSAWALEPVGKARGSGLRGCAASSNSFFLYFFFFLSVCSPTYLRRR